MGRDGLLRVLAFLAAAAAICVGWAYFRGLGQKQPKERQKEPLILPPEATGPVKLYAELMVEPTPPGQLALPRMGPPGLVKGRPPAPRKVVRSPSSAVALLSDFPASWGHELSEPQLEQMLAGAALREQKLVVVGVEHEEEKRFRLKTKGDVETPMVETKDGPVVYVFNNPTVLVENREDKVFPIRLIDAAPRPVKLDAEAALVHRAAHWLSTSGPRLANALPPALPPDGLLAEGQLAAFWADQALRHKGVKVVKVEKLEGGEWKLRTKAGFSLGARVKNKDGTESKLSLVFTNSDIIVKVRDDKLVPVRVD